MARIGEAPLRDDVREWAADVLKVGPEATPEVITAAFLQRLSDDDFSPAPEAAVAFDVLSGSSRADGEASQVWQVGVESLLREQFAQFTERYFSLPPAERWQIWKSLWERTEVFPALRLRLVRVQEGLRISAPDAALFKNATAGELLGLMQQCYVATPAQAARLRHAARPQNPPGASGMGGCGAAGAHPLLHTRPASSGPIVVGDPRCGRFPGGHGTARRATRSRLGEAACWTPREGISETNNCLSVAVAGNQTGRRRVPGVDCIGIDVGRPEVKERQADSTDDLVFLSLGAISSETGGSAASRPLGGGC